MLEISVYIFSVKTFLKCNAGSTFDHSHFSVNEFISSSKKLGPLDENGC